jgi:hypothetical protein
MPILKPHYDPHYIGWHATARLPVFDSPAPRDGAPAQMVACARCNRATQDKCSFCHACGSVIIVSANPDEVDVATIRVYLDRLYPPKPRRSA